MINSSLIEKYFSGSLSEDELLEFKQLYGLNHEFKKEIDFLKKLKTVAETEDAEQFKNTLQGFESEIYKKKLNIFSKRQKPLAATAAVLAIAFFITYFWTSKTDEATLFATYFQPSKNVSAPIVRSDYEQNLTASAFIAYTEKDYKKAAALFEKNFASSKKPELLFYEGNALLASGQTKKAIDTFKEYLTFEDTLTNRSHWYLALAYLKNKNLEDAKKELEAYIKSGDRFMNEEATLLLEKLK